jgi:hypothetical protein
MNAELVGKPLKGFVLASALALATSIPALAQDAAVDLGAQATTPLSGLYLNPPTGSVTLGGKPFSTGNFDWLAAGGSGTFAASYPNPTAVYVLVNSSWTSGWYAGHTVGTVQLTFSDGTTQSVALVEGVNVREWQIGASWTVNTVSDPSNTNVWLGSAGNGAAAAIDMLTVPVATTTRTLSSITVSNTDSTGGGLHLQVNGLAVSYTPPVVAPTTGPEVSGNPDNHGKHLGQLKHQGKDGDEKAKAHANGIAKHEN